VTPDLNAAFPAAYAREVGFQSVPLLCAVEIDVPGALARVLRVMIHCNTTRNPQNPKTPMYRYLF